MPSPSSKVILSFNKGELSPFLDSRVDLEGATSAAREMTNMYAEMGGEARRRPGLRMVSEVPEPPEFPPDVVLTNYIEMPFLQYNYHVPSINTIQTTIFRGIVRLWESGTVQFVGEVRTGNTSDRDYRVGVGATAGSAAFEVVATAPVGGAWEPVDWSHKLGAGEHLYILVESNDFAASAFVEAVAYPDGWQLPFTEEARGDAGSRNTGTLSRSGNDLSTQGSYAASLIFNTGIAITSWEVDITVPVDSTGWQLYSTTSHFNFSIPSATGGPFGPYTRTIPDSATVGIMFDHSLSGGTGTGIGYASRATMGPMFRTAYDPVVQQGVDPIP